MVHDTSCLTIDGLVICLLPEVGTHVHTDVCCIIRGGLLCEAPESEEHIHEAACYEAALACEIPEEEVHTHVDGCYEQPEGIPLKYLDPYAVEEMTSGEFDLPLFTCTYGGKSRVTVYCDKAD
jgi:hypothetical protein